MLNKLITVISLYYNNADTVYAAIDSVLCQDYSEIEYIIIDDGSQYFEKDKIEEYVNLHKSKGIREFKILQNSCNIGTIKSLNRAIRESSGEIIVNLASDDKFTDKSILAEWVECFERTNADVVTAKRAVFDAGKFLFEQPTEDQRNILKTTNNEIFEFIAPMNFIYGSNTARTRQSFVKYGLYDETYRLIEDYSSILQLLRKGAKIYYWDRTVINYRLGGVSEANNVNKAYLKENKAIFVNEALPFVKNKSAAKKKYKLWYIELRLNRYYVAFRNELALRNIDKNSLHGKVLHLKYYIRYMPYTLKGTLRKVFNQKKNR